MELLKRLVARLKLKWECFRGRHSYTVEVKQNKHGILKRTMCVRCLHVKSYTYGINNTPFPNKTVSKLFPE